MYGLSLAALSGAGGWLEGGNKRVQNEYDMGWDRQKEFWKENYYDTVEANRKAESQRDYELDRMYKLVEVDRLPDGPQKEILKRAGWTWVPWALLESMYNNKDAMFPWQFMPNTPPDQKLPRLPNSNVDFNDLFPSEFNPKPEVPVSPSEANTGAGITPLPALSGAVVPPGEPQPGNPQDIWQVLDPALLQTPVGETDVDRYRRIIQAVSILYAMPQGSLASPLQSWLNHALGVLKTTYGMTPEDIQSAVSLYRGQLRYGAYPRRGVDWGAAGQRFGRQVDRPPLDSAPTQRPATTGLRWSPNAPNAGLGPFVPPEGLRGSRPPLNRGSLTDWRHIAEQNAELPESTGPIPEQNTLMPEWWERYTPTGHEQYWGPYAPNPWGFGRGY